MSVDDVQDGFAVSLSAGMRETQDIHSKQHIIDCQEWAGERQENC